MLEIHHFIWIMSVPIVLSVVLQAQNVIKKKNRDSNGQFVLYICLKYEQLHPKLGHMKQ